MLKSIFTIPDTFDPDDRRQRQILNILLIIFIGTAIVGMIISSVVIYFHLDPNGISDDEIIFVPVIVFVLLSGIFLVANRRAKVPGWLNRTAFLAATMAMISQIDTPFELYRGRSMLAWIIPIMVAAIILRPAAVFVIETFVTGLITIFSWSTISSLNYYLIFTIFVIAFIAWLGMTIANNAIRDARHQAANLAAILDSIADGVLVLDRQSRFISANPALLGMIPQDELLEIINASMDETLKWKRQVFSVHTSDVPDVGRVAVFRDETRRHETESARDALLATASHELRTPLAAVMNYLELMLTLVRLNRVDVGEFQQYLTRALENSKRLQHLVDNILDQAQIQAGGLRLKNEPFDLRALLDKTRQLLDVFIQQKKLAYELSIAQWVPAQIRGDAERLQQVLVNLIGNAVKFTDRGGIRVSVSTNQDNELSIEVADSGVGIPSEQLPDIFEAFRRGGNYAQREHQGAGLGLSIVKEIVERMHGEISATSEPGVGSTFTVTIPLELA